VEIGTMEQDRRGRKRQPDQGRGLRPLHTLLPEQWASKALRVAMSEADWARFEAIVQDVAADAPTHARAYGRTLVHLVNSVQEPPPQPKPLHWMDWERRKALRLLSSVSSSGACDAP
jgi:hypothetical protein